MQLPWYKKVLYILLAPIIIGAWCIRNPQKVKEQFKKEWKF